MHGVRVVEVDRADRQDRHRKGKSGPLDAVSAARAAQSGRAAGAPKGRDGAVEAIRSLMVAKRSARNERTQAINQARALILTGPDELRARFAGSAPPRWRRLSPRCGPAPVMPPSTRCASRCASSGGACSSSMTRSAAWTSSSSRSSPPALLACSASTASARNRRSAAHRCRRPPGAAGREAAWGTCAPSPRSRPLRRRPAGPASTAAEPRGQPRFVADRDHPDERPPETRAYVQRRTAEGLSKKDIIRCLKRYVAREVYPYLRG